jgi:hypothetical protein
MVQKSFNCVGAIFKTTDGGYTCYSPNGVVLPQELLLKVAKTAPSDYTEAEFFEAVSAEYDKEAGR